MTVLGDGAREQDREGHDARREQGHKDEVRTRLRDDAHSRRKQDHQNCIVAYPVLNINELQPDTEYQQHPESPRENRRQMLPDDVVPEVFLHKMVRGEQQHKQHNHAQPRKQHIHPALAQQVYRKSFIYRAVAQMFNRGFAGVCGGNSAVGVGGVRVRRGGGFGWRLAGVGVRCVGVGGGFRAVRVCGVVVREAAGGEGGDEGGEADEHRNPLDTVGAFLPHRAPTGRATMRRVGVAAVVLMLRVGRAAFPVRGMDGVVGVDCVAFDAVGFGGTVGVVMLVAVAGVAAVADEVGEEAGDDGGDEEDGEEEEGLVGDHGEHDEGFISGRGNHHCDEGAEGEEAVGVEGDGSETAHTAGDRTEEGAEDDLAEFRAAETLEEEAAGFDVEGLDHHHHDDYEAGDQYGVS